MANQISELMGVDYAFGKHINKAFEGLSNAGPPDWKRFFAKPEEEKLFRGGFETPGDIIAMISRGKKCERIENGKTINQANLPVIAYHRKPGMSNDDKKGEILPFRPLQHNDEDFSMAIMPLILEYKVAIVAWDKPTLDKMQLAWYLFFATKNYSTPSSAV